MLKKLLKSSKCRRHFTSLLIAISSVGAAICLSWTCRRTTHENQINSTLFFIFFLLLTSCTTAKCYYGIGYSLLAALWLYSGRDSLNGIFTAFMAMSGMAVLTYTFSHRTGAQTRDPEPEARAEAAPPPDPAEENILAAIPEAGAGPEQKAGEEGEPKPLEGMKATLLRAISHEIGRASCRDRVCLSV